ncbi:5430_t:CDS:10, partial [Gigaspora margarita]
MPVLFNEKLVLISIRSSMTSETPQVDPTFQVEPTPQAKPTTLHRNLMRNREKASVPLPPSESRFQKSAKLARRNEPIEETLMPGAEERAIPFLSARIRRNKMEIETDEYQKLVKAAEKITWRTIEPSREYRIEIEGTRWTFERPQNGPEEFNAGDYYRDELRVKADGNKTSDCHPTSAELVKRSLRIVDEKDNLRGMIKRVERMSRKEKKINHRNNNFEEPLDDLDKALGIKPKNVSALEKDENKVNAAKDQELTYLRTKRKHLPILTRDVNIDIRAIGATTEVKNKVENNGVIVMHKIMEGNNSAGCKLASLRKVLISIRSSMASETPQVDPTFQVDPTPQAKPTTLHRNLMRNREKASVPLPPSESRFQKSAKLARNRVVVYVSERENLFQRGDAPVRGNAMSGFPPPDLEITFNTSYR